MYIRTGKFKTQVRASFSYDETGTPIRRFRSFENPPKGELTKKQYEKKIEKMASQIHDELVKEYYQEQALKSLGIEDGEYPFFSRLAQRWIDDRLYNKIHSQNTSIDEAKKINIINKYIGDKKIDQITSYDIDKCKIEIAKKENQGNGKKGQPLSGRTLLHYYSTLSAIFNFAVEKKILKSNPVDGATRPKVQNKTNKRPLTAEQRDLILKTVAEKESLMYKIGYYIEGKTGMRRGTLCALKFGDINRS
ncbi:MAG TPA: hypothetical protein VM577_07185, partial [Anaerovoracaceae bacterium]|nr:hypothetical protein [Anaerovoracaceae bacterium]